MGTVVEKVQYIAGTKSAIKTAIEAKGVTVGSTTTFRNYASKIGEISAAAVKAEYEFSNTLDDVVFPQTPTTETTSYVYDSSTNYVADTTSGFCCFAPNKTVEDTSYLFDDNLATYGSMVDGLFFKFDKPVKLKSMYGYCSGGGNFTLKGTNVAEIQAGGDVSLQYLWNEIYSGAYSESGNISLNQGEEYQYYKLTKDSGYMTVYELNFTAITGSVDCTLKTANMTPACKVYDQNYMQFVTQPWHDGTSIIATQTVIMKPYTDGGGLIGYTDDGSAVNLKMYLLKGTSDPVYVLSPDDTFTLPTGYSSKTLVADLDIPAHIYNNNGTWEMGGDNE